MSEKAKREQNSQGIFYWKRVRALLLSMLMLFSSCIICFAGSSISYWLQRSYTSLFWSPDSQYLLYREDETVLLRHIPTGTTQTLKLLPYDDDLVLRGFYDNDHVWFTDGKGIYKSNIHSLVRTSFALGDGYDRIASPIGFTPDHKSLLFYGWTQTRRQELDWQQIWMLDLETREITKGVELDSFKYGIRYSPDGSVMIAGHSYLENGTWQSLPQIETSERDYPASYSFSHDGRWILSEHIDASSNQPYRLILFPLDGHKEPQLLNREPMNEIQWSPNGCYVAYTTRGSKNQFKLIPARDIGLETFIKPGESCPMAAPSLFG